MEYIQHSKEIKKEADSLIATKKLNELFRLYGEVIYTGSYALNLMSWRDIDLQIKLADIRNANKVISSIFGHMVLDDEVLHMEYTNFSKKIYSKMPEGYYLQFKILHNNKEWKMDLWILNENDSAQNKIFMQRINELLTENPQLKDLIVDLKFELIGNNERPPKMASYYLYQALLNNKAMNKEEIKNFIRENNVFIS